jgi:two-component system nitrogen regulation sensor histidine kinase NtrY
MTPRSTAPSVSKLGRATSNTFRAFFALAVVIAAGGTYLAVTDTGQAADEQSSLLWLLLANLVLIFGVAGVLGFRVWGLIRENRATGGGARLRLRILFLFSLAAAIPTVLVAGFLAVAINRSVESWFGKPVYNLVENASAAARAAVDDVVEDVRSKAAVMASDLNSPNYAEAFGKDRELFKKLFETQVAIRELALASILDEEGKQVMTAAAPNAPAFRAPSESSWRTAREGLTAMSIDPNETMALIKLKGFDNAFLYVAQPIPPVVASRLSQAQRDLNGFRLAEARRTQLALVLTLCYTEAAMLMLLGTAWLGMAAAAGIAAPIGQLAGAARAVRDGDLSVRMERPRVRDEIDDLADAFNQMTERIARRLH